MRLKKEQESRTVNPQHRIRATDDWEPLCERLKQVLTIFFRSRGADIVASLYVRNLTSFFGFETVFSFSF